MSSEDFGQRLREHEREKKEFLVPEAQRKLIESLSLQIPGVDFKKSGRCFLVLERLKEKKRNGPMKKELNALGSLIKNYLEQKNRVQEELQKQVEQNPQLRMDRAKTNLGEVIIELSVGEIVSQSPQ